ncbi:TPA: hypothetical protein ACJ51G_001109 [Aeromonas hydrophila subsp. hydrophila]
MSDAIKTAKLQADKMSARLKQLGVVIKRTQCLEAIAAINNYPDWNRFSAALASGAASPVVTGVSQQMSERYIVGDMADISCSEYARKVFCAALRAGHQPIYVELISGRSRPFPPPAGAAVSKLDVLFDWEGDIRSTHDVISNLSKNENLFSDPALAEKLFPSPLHIALAYDPRPGKQSETEVDKAVERQKIAGSLASALDGISLFLANYCRTLASPMVIIDDSRDIGYGSTSLGRLLHYQVGKELHKVIDRLMGHAPSVLFIYSGEQGHVLGGRFDIKTFEANTMPALMADDSPFLASIKTAFNATERPVVPSSEKNINSLIRICALAGFDFTYHSELLAYLSRIENWQPEFLRLVHSHDRLVTVEPSLLASTLTNVVGESTPLLSAAPTLAQMIGDWVPAAIDTLKSRLK